jgi:hypothetical protein
MRHGTVLLGLALAALLLVSATGCTTVHKREGIFQATGLGVRLFGFTLPATDYETMQDAIAQEVGLDREIKTIWRSAYLRPWFNFLYPILGVEWIEVYGTY